jgi:hypothetical protein
MICMILGSDFHSLNPKELEASVKADLVLKPGLTHEVMVAKGGMFTFYRNGVVVKSVPSPRPVTDCDGEVVLLGHPSIALASVNFYARGLQANEVRPYPSRHTQMHSHITARPCTHSIARAHTHTHTHTLPPPICLFLTPPLAHRLPRCTLVVSLYPSLLLGQCFLKYRQNRQSKSWTR